jgi:hypothetical protein
VRPPQPSGRRRCVGCDATANAHAHCKQEQSCQNWSWSHSNRWMCRSTARIWSEWTTTRKHYCLELQQVFVCCVSRPGRWSVCVARSLFLCWCDCQIVGWLIACDVQEYK